MSAHFYPTPEPNPIKINPDGSQSPNPRYQGPNPYRKGADGKLTRIKPVKPVTPAGLGILKLLRSLGAAIPPLGAASLGAYGAYALAGSAGTSGAAKMSGLGIGGKDGLDGDAPTYPTPLNSIGKYKSRREGLENVYPDRFTPSYKSRREGLENVYPERYESNIEETKSTQTPTPTPEIASTFSSPLSSDFEVNFNDLGNTSTDYLPGYKESMFLPGYRENPLTAGSMKGDHKFINPRQKAIMAREELTERSRERKAAEAFRESIGTKDLFKPDEFAKGTEIFEKGFLNNPDNFDYPGLFDPNTRTGI